jgi:hypothetical protein
MVDAGHDIQACDVSAVIVLGTEVFRKDVAANPCWTIGISATSFVCTFWSPGR